MTHNFTATYTDCIPRRIQERDLCSAFAILTPMCNVTSAFWQQSRLMHLAASSVALVETPSMCTEENIDLYFTSFAGREMQGSDSVIVNCIATQYSCSNYSLGEISRSHHLSSLPATSLWSLNCRCISVGFPSTTSPCLTPSLSMCITQRKGHLSSASVPYTA